MNIGFSGNCPNKGSDGAAGSDLVCSKGGMIEAGGLVLVPTGTKVQIPKGYFGLLVARSSLCMKKGLMLANGVGIIDSDYRGEIKVALLNVSGEAVSLEQGERIAQLLVLPVESTIWVEGELEETGRGEGGFGSTGGYKV